MFRHCMYRLALITGTSLLTWATAVQAQEQSPVSSSEANERTQLEDIIVTAQKRGENLQDTPVSVSAISGEALTRQGIDDTTQLTAAVPSLVFSRTVNVGNFYLRGVGTNLFDPSSEQTVGVFVDGVYMPNPTANQFKLTDIERIEVLKGPQGTLFGRNTTGGVIQVVTRKPSQEPVLEISAGYDNYRTASVSAYATTGISDDVAISLSGFYEDQDRPYGRNLVNNKPAVAADGNFGVRGVLLFEPTPATEIKLSADYMRSKSSLYYHIPKGLVGPDGITTYQGRYNYSVSQDAFNLLRTGGVSLHVTQDLGGVSLVSISAYRKARSHTGLDQDVTPAVILDANIKTKSTEWTQELQLQSDKTGAFKWIIGGYYFNYKAGYDPAVINSTIVVKDHQRTESYAGFAQASYDLTERTTATAGIRYTYEKQKYVLPAFTALNDSATTNRVTWRLSLDHHFTDDVMGYVSWNRGSKSGGFNLLVPGTPPFGPETVDAYEVGLKSELLDRRVRLNMAAFYYDYRDIQVQTPISGATATSNGPKAKVQGIEADLQALVTDGLTISSGFVLLDNKFTKFPNGVAISANGVGANCALTPTLCDFKDNYLPASPKFSANIGAEYEIRTDWGTITPSATLLYNDGYYYYPDNRVRQPSYFLLNASLTWRSNNDRYGITIYGRNITDTNYFEARAEQLGLSDVDFNAAPATVGVTFSAKY